MNDYKTFASSWIGTRQGSQRHKQIVDGYNTIKPLPDGYRLSYNDPWCAGFASFVLSKCRAVNAPLSASVLRMKEKARKNKQIVKIPRVNDLILYNWNGDGVPDHVGIIFSINGELMQVIEGNMSRAVGVRTISKKSKYIDCYIRVPAASPDLESVAHDVIRGRYGNGDDRKKNLTAAGYNPTEVQRVVNSILKQ